MDDVKFIGDYEDLEEIMDTILYFESETLIQLGIIEELNSKREEKLIQYTLNLIVSLMKDNLNSPDGITSKDLYSFKKQYIFKKIKMKKQYEKDKLEKIEKRLDELEGKHIYIDKEDNSDKGKTVLNYYDEYKNLTSNQIEELWDKENEKPSGKRNSCKIIAFEDIMMCKTMG